MFSPLPPTPPCVAQIAMEGVDGATPNLDVLQALRWAGQVRGACAGGGGGGAALRCVVLGR